MNIYEKILTISIAAYNVESFIKKTISSCLTEDTKNLIEILVVDDGATDRTAIIADEFEKQYPDTVHVIKKENGGYGSTINSSVSQAKGKYFKLLDGDDWFNTEGLVSLISDLQISNADMFINPFLKFSEKDGTIKIFDAISEVGTGEYSWNSNIDIIKVLQMHYITFKTEILQETNRKISENCFYTDVEFVAYPLSKVKKIYVSHIPVYCYRIGRDEQSMSIAGIRKHINDHEMVLQNLFDLYKEIEDKDLNTTKVLYQLIEIECHAHYRYLCTLKVNLKNLKKLIGFDKKLKKYNPLYKDLSDQSRRINYLRKTKFLLYAFVCFRVRRKKKLSSW